MSTSFHLLGNNSPIASSTNTNITITTPTPTNVGTPTTNTNGGVTLAGQLLSISNNTNTNTNTNNNSNNTTTTTNNTTTNNATNNNSNNSSASVENITIYILPVGIQTSSLPPFLMKKYTLFKRLFAHISQRFSIDENQLVFLFQDRIDPEQCPNDIGLVSGETIVVRKIKNKLYEAKQATLSNFISNIGSLFNNPVYSDISFKLLDGSVLNSHKNILSSRCQKFQAMFQTEMKESTLKEIEILNYEPLVFRKMVEYLYSDSLNEDNIEMILQLIIIADEYLLDTLKNHCELKLITEINSNNVASFLLKSDIYNCKHLKKSSLEYILANVKKLIQDKDFNKTLSESPNLLLEVIQEMAPLYDDSVNNARKNSYFTINGN